LGRRGRGCGAAGERGSTMLDLDAEIAFTLKAALQSEQQSDEAFARGDIARGAQLYRDAVRAYLDAEELARQAAFYQLATH
jgi:hypothetical protein